MAKNCYFLKISSSNQISECYHMTTVKAIAFCVDIIAVMPIPLQLCLYSITRWH